MVFIAREYNSARFEIKLVSIEDKILWHVYPALMKLGSSCVTALATRYAYLFPIAENIERSNLQVKYSAG